MSDIFLILGCLIFILLGSLHWHGVAFTNKFEPKDDSLLAELKSNYSVVTNQTSIWNGMVGFHMSHSLGLIVFGFFYISLVLENPAYLQDSVVLNMALIFIPTIYILLAQKYWFSIPRNGFILSLSLFITSIVLR
jgi:hypothetical protein